jgi:hypothetical protein
MAKRKSTKGQNTIYKNLKNAIRMESNTTFKNTLIMVKSFKVVTSNFLMHF